MKFDIIHEESFERQPHPRAVAEYGEWKECRRMVVVSKNVFGNVVRMHHADWYDLKETVLDAPDSDTKRNARLEGDELVWEHRVKTFWIDVADLDDLLRIIGNNGALYCDDGRCHIEIFE